MKKLEEIAKNNPFTVPEGYFDRLPGVIQAKVVGNAEPKVAVAYFRYALQYALPLVLLLVVAVFYFKPETTSEENLLSSVSTEELMAYLEEDGITTDELLNGLELDAESVEAIENEVYFNFDMDEANLEELTFELNNL